MEVVVCFLQSDLKTSFPSVIWSCLCRVRAAVTLIAPAWARSAGDERHSRAVSSNPSRRNSSRRNTWPFRNETSWQKVCASATRRSRHGFRIDEPNGRSNPRRNSTRNSVPMNWAPYTQGFTASRPNNSSTTIRTRLGYLPPPGVSCAAMCRVFL